MKNGCRGMAGEPLKKFSFVDTNVLVYAVDRTEPTRQGIAQELLEKLWADHSGLVSTQVLIEFYSTTTKKLKVPLSRAEAREIVALYSRWRVIPTDPELILSATWLEDEHTVSFWDSLIVRAALRASATWLISEDLQDGRRFGSLTVRNPFSD